MKNNETIYVLISYNKKIGEWAIIYLKEDNFKIQSFVLDAHMNKKF